MAKLWRSLVLVALLSGTALPVWAQQRNPDWATPVAQAQNLFQITPGFYRSAQMGKDDVERLQKLGIKTVLSLRSFHDDKAILEGTGIAMRRVPINTWAVNDQNVLAALRELRTAQKEGPVLLHCQHGADRTGLISAMYRMVYQGWSREQALDELRNGGYGYHAMWKNIVRYLQRVDVEKIKKGLEG